MDNNGIQEEGDANARQTTLGMEIGVNWIQDVLEIGFSIKLLDNVSVEMDNFGMDLNVKFNHNAVVAKYGTLNNLSVNALVALTGMAKIVFYV